MPYGIDCKIQINTNLVLKKKSRIKIFGESMFSVITGTFDERWKAFAN